MGNSVGVLVSRVWGMMSASDNDYPPEDEAKPGSRSGVTIFRAVNHVNHGAGVGGRMPFSEYTTILRLSDSDPQHFSLSLSCYRDLDIGDASMAFTEKQFLGIVKPEGPACVLVSTHQMLSDSAHSVDESYERNVTPTTKAFLLRHLPGGNTTSVVVAEEPEDNTDIFEANLYPSTLFHTHVAED